MPTEGAIESEALGDRIPSNPADRLIVATALMHDLTLITSDGPIPQEPRRPYALVASDPTYRPKEKCRTVERAHQGAHNCRTLAITRGDADATPRR